MSFLTPAFLFGALALALPVVFHLIRSSTRDRLPFSSLQFLQPTPPRLTKRSRLEDLLLLLLRCLALALLALGFARPFLKQPSANDPVAGQLHGLLHGDHVEGGLGHAIPVGAAAGVVGDGAHAAGDVDDLAGGGAAE